MIQMEINTKDKTIKIKDNVKLSDLQKILSETLVNWQEYTLIPGHVEIHWNYPKPYTWIQPRYTPNYYFGVDPITYDNKDMTLTQGPTKL